MWLQLVDDDDDDNFCCCGSADNSHNLQGILIFIFISAKISQSFLSQHTYLTVNHERWKRSVCSERESARKKKNDVTTQLITSTSFARLKLKQQQQPSSSRGFFDQSEGEFSPRHWLRHVNVLCKWRYGINDDLRTYEPLSGNFSYREKGTYVWWNMAERNQNYKTYTST